MNQETATPLHLPNDIKRRPISRSGDSLVKTGTLREGETLPLAIAATVPKMKLQEWIIPHLDSLQQSLLQHGAILFRNFAVESVSDFEAVIRAVSAELLEYNERSSPRSKVSGNIYSSTDHPPDQSIFLHNENSYQHTWPLKIFFHSVIVASKGGETPIADCRKVMKRLSPQLREKFLKKGCMYVRNHGDGFGLPWQTVYQTEDKSVVEAHCRKYEIDFEWKANNGLRTRVVRPAMSRHPKTQELVWFNHVTFFNVSTLSPFLRDFLLQELGEENLPTNTYYGDGSPIESSVLDELHEAYHRETVTFPWQVGDVLMMDNMLAAHARAPFSGSRKVVVGMAEPVLGETAWYREEMQ